MFTYWALRHYYSDDLRYLGYGGTRKQVRDLLHVDDLIGLIDEQLLRPEHWDEVTTNVGGGPDFSLCLLETTELCRELTGNRIDVVCSGESRAGDVRIYLSDCARLHSLTDWRPTRGPRRVLQDIVSWIHENERVVGTPD